MKIKVEIKALGKLFLEKKKQTNKQTTNKTKTKQRNKDTTNNKNKEQL